jgi:hypothetical protein
MPRRFAPVALLAAVVTACSSTAPSPSPAPTPQPTSTAAITAPPSPSPTASPRPLAQVYADIRSQVEAIRGLAPTKAVEPVVIDAAQLAKNLVAEFDASHDAATLKDTDDLLQALGLMPVGTSLRDATLAFQAGQVAGYYSPEADKLFVVSRTAAVGPADESTYAHEFTHQLQDQHVDLDKLGIDVSDQSDRSLARLALVEGDATSVQTSWMTKYLSSTEMGEVFAAGLDPAALKAFNDAPPYLRETALFPYQEGLAFVTRLVTNGGYPAVDPAFAEPPNSTEQVLHPDTYVAREAPLVVKIPAGIASKLGAGWSEVGQDTLGEFLLRLWLKLGGVPVVDATRAAAGWGGDRVVLYRGPGGETTVGIVTTWDDVTDAGDFFDQAGTARHGLGLVGDVQGSGSNPSTVIVAIGPKYREVLAGLGGVPGGVGG